MQRKRRKEAAASQTSVPAVRKSMTASALFFITKLLFFNNETSRVETN